MKKSLVILAAFTYIGMTAALYAAFLYAPTERTMGEIQRIFYFHVPAAWVSFLAFAVVFVGGIAFLRTGKSHWDVLAYSAGEVGVFFLTLVLVSGPLWAKPVWNVFWTWDARLTTSLVLWLIFIVYLMLRSSLPGEKGARFAAVFGIIGFLDVPLVYMSIRWWRTLHPAPVLGGKSGSGLEAPMLATLMIALFGFTLLLILLLYINYKISRAEKDLELFDKEWRNGEI
ncbi:MAG: cytochrome c biogenesis protein [candidate division KSB1 bacterium]|nr:cytochrome c biogenesis protein [candidate division KSB1 bacterium]